MNILGGCGASQDRQNWNLKNLILSHPSCLNPTRLRQDKGEVVPSMKIGFCIPGMVIGGVESVFANTLDALHKYYPDVEIVVFPHAALSELYYIEWFKTRPYIKVKPFFPLCEQFENARRYMRGFPLKQIRKIVFSLYKRFKNFQMAHSHELNSCDVIIDYVTGSSYKMLRHVSKPKATWLHCSINYFNDYRMHVRMPYYDKIVCISDSCMNDFREQYPQYSERLTRIYNPVNCAEISEYSRVAPRYDGKYFVCVSRMDNDKDIPTIIRAFNKFWSENNQPDCKMVFIGSGNILDAMREMAQKSPAAENIVFLGKIPRPFGYMRGGLAHILSSYNEGLPTVLIEAMAAGTLNISSNCKNGPHEILMNGDAGILFEPGNADELATAMSDIWNGKADTNQMVKTATESLSRFEPKHIADEIIRLVVELKEA